TGSRMLPEPAGKMPALRSARFQRAGSRGFPAPSFNSGRRLPGILGELAERFNLLLGTRLVVLREIFFEIEENNLAAGEFEFERDMDQPVQVFFHLRLPFRRNEQQNETAATRAE